MTASLFQTYLPELELKYDNRIAVSGTATPAAPFIVPEIEPDIRSATLRALDWLEPVRQLRHCFEPSLSPPPDTRRVICYTFTRMREASLIVIRVLCPNLGLQAASTDAADWTTTFAGCGLTGPVYFEAGGSTNISLGGVAGSISSAAFDSTGCSVCKGCHVPPALDKYGVAVLRSPKIASNTTASSTSVNVVNFCERSPHYFITAKMSRCRIMDRCRREWGCVCSSLAPPAPPPPPPPPPWPRLQGIISGKEHLQSG